MRWIHSESREWLGVVAVWIVLLAASPVEAQLFQASLKNGDYGGGTAVAPATGVVNSADGVTFVSTENSGASNGLINWQLNTASRGPFRSAGTVSFCFRANRSTFVSGSILGDNYGYGQFNNGQGSFGAFASRLANGPGDADDQISVTWHSWHNNVWHVHSPATLEFDRTYRLGFAWGATATRFELWVDGVMAGGDNIATLPWGSSQFGTGSATNFGLGTNHQRGVSPYSSAAGVTFSNIRIWSGYRPSADSSSGCLSMSIDGPDAALTNRPATFEAVTTGCTPSRTGWTWTTTGGATISGGTTRTATMSWPAAGTFTVSASNSACSGANPSKSVRVSAAPPNVIVTSLPGPLVQGSNAGGGTTTFTLVNDGDSATNITLAQQGTFFTAAPGAFALAARASQVVTLTGTARAANVYRGSVNPSGAGVPSGFSIPVVLIAAPTPSSAPRLAPGTNRVDLAGGPTTSPTGSVTFTNSGAGTMTGALVSSEPWLIPQSELIVIAPGASANVSFSVDRTKRPDSDALAGSVSGELQLVFRTAAAGAGPVTNDNAPSSGSKVTVIDTVSPPVTTGPLPALAPGELALIVPGVGHVMGSVGLFLSDLSIVNRSGLGSITDAKLYYTPLGGTGTTQLASLGTLVANQPFALADLVKTVFKNDAQIGSLQIRSKDIAKLAVGASIFNVSNAKGTFGTTIPVFRTDRGVAPGGKLYLTGLRSDSTGHTNLYLQETAGLGASVTTQFLSAPGAVVGTRSDDLGPFALLQLGRVAPPGAVAAVLTNSTASAGRFLAYATPVDGASGDTWAVADWRQVDAYSGSEPALIPIAGALHGANSTYFRTDVAVMNTSAATASGTMRYYNRNGEIIDRVLSLGPLESRLLDDITTTFFSVTTDSAGHVLFTPSSGSFAITSRTYTTVLNDVATYGTGVPTRSLAASLGPGDVRRIGGVDDASPSSISAGRAATFRTNFVMVETSGKTVNIRVTVRFGAPMGKVTANIAGSKDYTLGPRQFTLLGGVAREVLGAGRDAFGDLRNVQVEFSHIGGDGTVEVFLSSVDNGSGDSILRVE